MDAAAQQLLSNLMRLDAPDTAPSHPLVSLLPPRPPAGVAVVHLDVAGMLALPAIPAPVPTPVPKTARSNSDAGQSSGAAQPAR